MNYDISDDVSMPLSTIIEVTDNVDELTQRSVSPKTILLTDVSRRLNQRKHLYKQLYAKFIDSRLFVFNSILSIIVI